MTYSFENDMMFGKKVKSGYLDDVGETVYWLNGTGHIHSGLMKLVGDEKTRQEGWEKAVYMLASDENGERRYNTDTVHIKEFHDKVDHSLARSYGMLIMGMSKGKVDDNFEMEVKEEAKNSRPVKGTSNT